MQKSESQLQLEKEVKKELAKIKRRVRNISKRGYSVPESIVPTLPKKITEKTLSRFQKISPQEIYKRSVYVSPTGTKIKGTERRKQERSESARKGYETRRNKFYANKPQLKAPDNEYTSEAKIIMLTVEDLIWQISFGWYDRSRLWTHNNNQLESIRERDSNMLLNILNEEIGKSGKNIVLARINANAKEIYEILDLVLLASGEYYHISARAGEVNQKIQRFAEIIKGNALTAAESIYFSELAEEQSLNEPV